MRLRSGMTPEQIGNRPPYAAAVQSRPKGACYCDLTDEDCYAAGHWSAVDETREHMRDKLAELVV